MKIPATLALLVGCAGLAGMGGLADIAGRAAAASTAARAADSAPTADEVLRRNLAALGGEAKVRAVRTVRFAATQWSGGASGRSVPVTVYWKRPDKIRLESPEEGIVKVVAFDGATAWATYPELPGFEPQILAGAARDSLREQADLLEGPTFDYAAKGNRIALLGRERIGDGDAWRLLLTTAGGEKRTFWFDCRTFLEVREERAQTIAGRELTNVSVLSDFRPAGGILFAHRVESRLRATGEPSTGTGESSVFTVEQLEVDVEIPDSLFALPAPVAPPN